MFFFLLALLLSDTAFILLTSGILTFMSRINFRSVDLSIEINLKPIFYTFKEILKEICVNPSNFQIFRVYSMIRKSGGGDFYLNFDIFLCLYKNSLPPLKLEGIFQNLWETPPQPRINPDISNESVGN